MSESERKNMGGRAGNGGALGNRGEKKDERIKDSVVLECGQKR